MTAQQRAMRLASILAALALTLLMAAPAQATFPGKNGRIIFASKRTGEWQLHSINPDGSNIRQITHLPAPKPGSISTAFLPDVSPDGRRVVFSHEADDDVELYLINLDGTGLTRLTSDPGRFDGARTGPPMDGGSCSLANRRSRRQPDRHDAGAARRAHHDADHQTV